MPLQAENLKGSLMKTVKNFLHLIFIDGLSGMAQGLFATLIIGTIIQQVGTFAGGTIGHYIFLVGKMAAAVTGAGIGCGVAIRFKESTLTVISAGVCGMTGAFASKILAGAIITSEGVVSLNGPGEPLGAFIAALVGIAVGHLISGRTSLDILLTPLCAIAAGAAAGLLAGPYISRMMNELGALINWGTNQQPLLMGVIVSVLMGMALTLPISSAALGIILNLTGIAAGAATIGCCCNMVGFAVASYRENKAGGLLAQGLGTSMIQISNIVKNPMIWLPEIFASAILGPVSTVILKMENNATGSGMGTSGLVGPIMVYQTMAAKEGSVYTIVLIVVMCFFLPGVFTLGFSSLFRKKGWIKNGDMKLEVS